MWQFVDGLQKWLQTVIWVGPGLSQRVPPPHIHISSSTLELGGKFLVIVGESADIVDAAKKLVRAKFLNAGQICMALDYVLAHVSIMGKLVWQLGETIRETYGTDLAARRASPDYARIVSPAHLARCEQLLTASLKMAPAPLLAGKWTLPTATLRPPCWLMWPNKTQ